LISRLEERRKVKGQAYYERKKAMRKMLVDAKKNASVDSKVQKQLEEYGY
jgi:large subunit ribosomal protein L13Ae